jgi:hypothetical protein
MQVIPKRGVVLFLRSPCGYARDDPKTSAVGRKRRLDTDYQPSGHHHAQHANCNEEGTGGDAKYPPICRQTVIARTRRFALSFRDAIDICAGLE